MPETTIDGDAVNSVTIDGDEVTEITVDGDVVFITKDHLYNEGDKEDDWEPYVQVEGSDGEAIYSKESDHLYLKADDQTDSDLTGVNVEVQWNTIQQVDLSGVNSIKFRLDINLEETEDGDTRVWFGYDTDPGGRGEWDWEYSEMHDDEETNFTYTLDVSGASSSYHVIISADTRGNFGAEAHTGVLLYEVWMD